MHQLLDVTVAQLHRNSRGHLSIRIAPAAINISAVESIEANEPVSDTDPRATTNVHLKSGNIMRIVESVADFTERYNAAVLTAESSQVLVRSRALQGEVRSMTLGDN